MDSVWYVVGFMVVIIGVMSKKYVFNNPSSNNNKKISASSNTYPVPGDLMTEVQDKWKRPVKSLPVHVDIPRLARKITVYKQQSNDNDNNNNDNNNNNNNTNNNEPQRISINHEVDSDSTSDNNVIKELISTLSNQLGDSPEQQENISSNFNEYFRRTADPSHALADFLEMVVGHESSTSSVLKACNQSVLAPGVLQLKYAIGNYFPYKDARGSWKIDIVVAPDWVSVGHLKREKSFDESPLNYFEFTWGLKLIFNRDITVLKDIELYIDDVTFSDSMSTQTKKKIHSVLQPFLRPSTSTNFTK